MKNSEPIVREYLKEWLHDFHYEKTIGTKNPDFSLWAEDKPIAFWDVADRDWKPEDHEYWNRVATSDELVSEPEVGECRGYRFVRGKVKQKSEQFMGCSPTPGMLVLSDTTSRAWAPSDVIAAALYGWPQLTIQLGGKGVTGRSRKLDGKMNDPRFEGANRYVAAIGILTYQNVLRYYYGLEQFCGEAFERFGVSAHPFHLASKIERELRAAGKELDVQLPVLDVYLTYQAHHPWPMDLVGPWDRVFEYNPSTLSFDLVRDGLRARHNIPVPASQAQRDIEVLMRDPLLRA